MVVYLFSEVLFVIVVWYCIIRFGHVLRQYPKLFFVYICIFTKIVICWIGCSIDVSRRAILFAGSRRSFCSKIRLSCVVRILVKIFRMCSINVIGRVLDRSSG